MATPDSEIQELTKAAVALMERIDKFNEDSGAQVVQLAKEAKRRRRVQNLLIAAVVFMLGLSVVVGFAYAGVRSNTARLDETATVNRQKALCPLYSVILASNTPASRDAARDKTFYDKTIKVIREGYVALECDDFKGSAPTLGSKE